MTSEYVRLSPDESFFGEKGMLESNLSAVSLLKGMKEYHKIRKEELLLKLEFKKKLSELHALLKWFDKQLPKTDDEEKQEFEESIRTDEDEKKEFELEGEILDIKRKLSSLKH